MPLHNGRKDILRRLPKNANPTWQVTMDKKFRVPLWGLDVRVGQRVYFSITEERGSIRICASPKGALRRGKYQSSRVQRLDLGQRQRRQFRRQNVRRRRLATTTTSQRDFNEDALYQIRFEDTAEIQKGGFNGDQ